MASDSSRKSLGLRIALSIALIVLLMAAGAGGFGLLMSMRKPPDRTAGHPPRTAVQVEAAQRTDYREIVGGYGRARPLRAAEVAAEVAALIVSVADDLEAGNHVESGAELVRLDDRDFRLALTRAETAVRQAHAEVTRHRSTLGNLTEQLVTARGELEAAERELERVRGDARTGAASASELDARQMQKATRQLATLALQSRQSNAEADLERARAELARAEATVEQARNDLERTVVRAPYAGRIVERLAQPGSRVSPGSPLFRIVDTSRVEVPIALPANRFGRVATGAKASLRLSESGDVVWAGPVARVSPGVHPESRTFQAYLVVEAAATAGADTTAESPVPPGAFVVAEIESTLHRGVFVLPRAALVGELVYVAQPRAREDGGGEGDGLPEAVVTERRPQIGVRLPDVVLATGGIEPDELVVVSNVEDIAEGTRVRLIAQPGFAPDAAAAPVGPEDAR